MTSIDSTQETDMMASAPLSAFLLSLMKCSVFKAKAEAVGSQQQIDKDMANSVRKKRVADRALEVEMAKRPRVPPVAQKFHDAMKELEQAVDELLLPCP
ncbi:hypothetical protein CORC01_00071 [Colletotrichum orchidophilum]|uniref:Uncharacterized protein n=1 Tax=Colletotrichum orchidophilum TaxID=1209926 RepID=A0A1G4BT70_9PEZI|nr:uncharacterized protein CORC01_00071 [Colletotrichum orchidophilum]OHF04600.1 hypothetical protein CORC01_00071 [Colletotrichum orchidophilum]